MRTGQFVATAALALATTAAAPSDQTVPFSFHRLGPEAGLTGLTVFGGKATNRYLLETTGSGVAMLDYDNDGRSDLFTTGVYLDTLREEASRLRFVERIAVSSFSFRRRGRRALRRTLRIRPSASTARRASRSRCRS